MNTPAADDYSAIKARMEEIEADRIAPRAEDVPEEPKQIQHGSMGIKTYMGWDIYAPHCLALNFGPELS